MSTKHKRRVHKGTKKKRNVAKGRTQTLREQVAKSRSMAANLRSQVQEQRSSTRRSSSKPIIKKEVRIVTPENEIYEYYLSPREEKMKKKDKINGIKKCIPRPHKEEDFPCKMKRTVFLNKEDFEDYNEMKYLKNSSTGFKSRSQHYDDIDEMLDQQQRSSK